MAAKKDYRRIERIMKGVASHRRIEILDLLKAKPELSVIEIADELKIDFKNASAHICKFAIAGLVMKRHDVNSVRHKLTPRGRHINLFYNSIEL